MENTAKRSGLAIGGGKLTLVSDARGVCVAHIVEIPAAYGAVGFCVVTHRKMGIATARRVFVSYEMALVDAGVKKE